MGTTVKVIKTWKVNSAYSAGRGWGGERYMTIQNDTVRDEMDRRANRLIYGDSANFSRIQAAVTNMNASMNLLRANIDRIISAGKYATPLINTLNKIGQKKQGQMKLLKTIKSKSYRCCANVKQGK